MNKFTNYFSIESFEYLTPLHIERIKMIVHDCHFDCSHLEKKL